MNGGFGNRAALRIAPPGGLGAHVRRDVMRLLASRDRYTEQCGYAAEGGLALVWLAPWDGKTSLRRDRLDPWYIEICRRVRLGLRGAVLVGHGGTSKVPRIVPIDGGVTGDPWSPTVMDAYGRLKALTVDARGFGYRRMVDFMFRGRGVEPSPLQTPASADAAEGLQLVARAMVLGRGKTDGYHERRVPISRCIRDRFVELTTDAVASAATERTNLAGEMQDRVLKTALFALFQNGPDQIDFRRGAVQHQADTGVARDRRHAEQGLAFDRPCPSASAR